MMMIMMMMIMRIILHKSHLFLVRHNNKKNSNIIVFSSLVAILVLSIPTHHHCLFQPFNTLPGTATAAVAVQQQTTPLSQSQLLLLQRQQVSNNLQRNDSIQPTLAYQHQHQSTNLTLILIDRFRHIFPEGYHTKHDHTTLSLPSVISAILNETLSAATAAEVTNNQQQQQPQSTLETRKIDSQDSSRQQQQSNNQQQIDQQFQQRNYFKILNKVFSRVDLPEQYKAPRLQSGGHCAQHIGCVEEIPNFPSLLRKANVSSSFTIYNRETSKNGHKLLFEPIVHHQLQDADTSELELQERLKGATNSRQLSNINNYSLSGNNNGRQRQTAVSWRSAAKIIHSQEYPFDLASLEQSGFNASLNTRIIIGGYFAKEDEEWIDEVVRQWLLLEPSNIIKVSWADSNRGLYHTAAYNSRIVGRQLTLFLYYLDQMFHINLDRFHLVGHSLGAHIAGIVGSDFDGRIARITGLDPAGPIFVELNASMRLDPTDAKFVDVVHTNGGTITKGALGLSTPSGHVDYYCNGGSIQPGCYFSSVTKSIMDPVERVACNHRRSYRYFIEIIKLTISEMPTFNLSTGGYSTSGELELGGLTRRDSDALRHYHHQHHHQFPTSDVRYSQLPRAFLFEAKQDDLVKLMQPEIALMSSNTMRREISELAPLKRTIEFHLLAPEFPPGKRGMYFFKTRSETPFFASRQYALTIKTDSVIRRKMALMAKIDHTLVAEVELDEIPGVYTLVFASNDPRLVNINLLDQTRVPQLSLMWRQRSFNLLLNQQNELHLSGLELSLLDSDEEEQPVIKYSSSQMSPSSSSSSASSLLKSGLFGTNLGVVDIALNRNQWYKFEGRLAQLNRNV